MKSTINHSMNWQEWFMLLTLSILWGGSFFFVGVAVKELPTFTIVTLRVALAACFLWLFLFAKGYRITHSGKIWSSFLVMGCLNNVVPFSLIVWGQTQIASGLASILNATTPLFTIIIAGIWLPDEKMTPAKVFGIVIGFLGIIVLFEPSTLQSLGTQITAQLAVLGASMSYGFAGVYGRKFKRMGVSPLFTATGQVMASSIVLLPITFLLGLPERLAFPTTETILAIGALALLSTAVAYILYFRILETAGATNALLVTFLVPVSAILLGYFVLNERLDLAHFVGMGCIGAGLLIIDGRILKKRT